MSLSPEARALLFDNESDDSDDEMFQKVMFKPSNRMTEEEEKAAAKRERWDMFADDWNHDMSDPLVRAKKRIEEERAKEAKKKPRKAKKKKNTQKITKFYKKEKNWQGKPMKNCKYEHSVQSYVFRPPKYGKKSDEEYLGYEKHFCDKCLLKPCMTAEFHSEMFDFGYGKEENARMDEVQASVEAFGMTCLNPHLGKRYVAKMAVPKCLTQFVRHWYPADEEGESDDELFDEDEDSESNACHEGIKEGEESESEEEENEF
jgi:hypothetical protein